MAIQGTQVPMYTKHTQFLYFSDFSIFKKKKTKQSTKNRQQHKSMKERCICMEAL